MVVPFVSAVHEKRLGPETVDFRENLQSVAVKFLQKVKIYFVFAGTGKKAAAKKRPAAAPCNDNDESDDSNDGDPDDESAKPLSNKEPAIDDTFCRPPRKSKKLWSTDEMANLRKNFRVLEHIDDSILAQLTFKEISAVASKREKNGKLLTEKLTSACGHLRWMSWPARTIARELCTKPDF
jgi:hypothetical protein